MGTGEFHGKTVFITGAVQDQGRSVALSFARAGANIALFESTRPPGFPGTPKLILENLGILAADLRSTGALVEVFLGDVRNEAEVARAVEKTVAAFGGIDVLFNNTGVATAGQCWELSEEAWDEVLDVNLKGAWIVAKWVAPEMIRAQSGVILNNSAEPESCEGRPSAHYTASRWGVAGLTKALACELAPFGVRALSLHTEEISATPADVSAAALYLAGPGGRAWEGTEYAVEPGVRV